MKMTVIASGSSGNCYVLEGTRSALILECGVTPERLMAGTTLDMTKVAGCLVSHEHGDHAAFMQRYGELGLPIICSPGTLAALNPTPERTHVKLLSDFQTYKLDEWTIASFEVKHDAAQPFGFLISHPEMGLLLFITDTGPIPWNFRANKPDHIMVEANYDDEIMDSNVREGRLPDALAGRTRRSHLSLRHAIDFVKANETERLKTVTLMHLSQGNSSSYEFQKRMQDAVLFAEVQVARPGLVVDMDRRFKL